ncbi:MAG: YwqG family protein [Parasphingorhabdus sp.]
MFKLSLKSWAYLCYTLIFLLFASLFIEPLAAIGWSVFRSALEQLVYLLRTVEVLQLSYYGWHFFWTAIILLAICGYTLETIHNRKLRAKLIADDPSKAIPISQQEVSELEAWLDDRALPYAAMTIGDTPPVDAHGSRIGGPAAFLPDAHWPISKNGKPMIFLTQINFSEMPKLPDYPETGLLQIFVDDGDSFGLDYDDYLANGKKIIWHEAPEKASLIINPPNAPKAYSAFQSKDVWMEGRTITFKRGTMRPHWNNWTIFEKLEEFAHRPNEDQIIEQIFDGDARSEDYVGGYPRFTQDDIRSAEEYPDYDRVLFQMGSDDHVMWGDVGEAMFMIKREDLLARKFDNIIYSWDCH